MKLFKNLKIYTCEGEVIENGYILIDGKKIKEVGKAEDVPAFGGEEFDFSGKVAVPGFVDAHSHIGIFGNGGTALRNDLNETSELVVPHLRAIDGVNPMDEYFAEALSSGVTTVVTGPGSTNPIAGIFTAMKTCGKRIDSMIIKEEAAMKFAFGENTKTGHGGEIKTRMKTAALIREALYKAKEYTGEPFDLKMEALKKVLNGEMIMKAHAHRADDIFTALRIAKEFSLKISLDHCTEGHLIADELREEKAFYCFGPIMGDRGKLELLNKTLDTLLVFEKEGINFSIICDHPEVPQGDLLLCAQLAARHGISHDTALRAITINPAKSVGIDDRVGSIKEGKDADILIFSGEPMDFNSKLLEVYFEGEKIKKG